MTDHPGGESLVRQLRAIPFFSGLDDQVIHDLARDALWREYSAGEVIFLEGEQSRGLHYLQSGWLKITKFSPDGREQVLQFLGPGETFHVIGVFANRPNPATAIALEPVGIGSCAGSRDGAAGETSTARPARHRENGRSRPGAGWPGRGSIPAVCDSSPGAVAGRGCQGQCPAPPRWYTQAEIAARLGTVPDVLQRALSSLADDGLIDVEPASFTFATGKPWRPWPS